MQEKWLIFQQNEDDFPIFHTQVSCVLGFLFFEGEREREGEWGERDREKWGAVAPLRLHHGCYRNWKSASKSCSRCSLKHRHIHTNKNTHCLVHTHTHTLACIPELLSSIHCLLGDQLPLSFHSQENYSTIIRGYSGQDYWCICHFHVFVSSDAELLSAEHEEEGVAWKLP